MPFTFVHGFISYIIVRAFSRDRNIRLLSLLGGMAPDIDGYGLLIGDFELYRRLHHEWLHPPFYGLLFGIIFSFIFWLYTRKKNITFRPLLGTAVFFFGYALHSLTDIFTSDWAINFAYPFGKLYLGDILNLKSPILLNSLDLTISAAVILLVIIIFYKDRTFLTEFLKK